MVEPRRLQCPLAYLSNGYADRKVPAASHRPAFRYPPANTLPPGSNINFFELSRFDTPLLIAYDARLFLILCGECNVSPPDQNSSSLRSLRFPENGEMLLEVGCHGKRNGMLCIIRRLMLTYMDPIYQQLSCEYIVGHLQGWRTFLLSLDALH